MHAQFQLFEKLTRQINSRKEINDHKLSLLCKDGLIPAKFFFVYLWFSPSSRSINRHWIETEKRQTKSGQASSILPIRLANLLLLSLRSWPYVIRCEVRIGSWGTWLISFFKVVDWTADCDRWADSRLEWCKEKTTTTTITEIRWAIRFSPRTSCSFHWPQLEPRDHLELIEGFIWHHLS